MKIVNFIASWLYEILGVGGALVLMSNSTTPSKVVGLLLLVTTGYFIYRRLND